MYIKYTQMHSTTITLTSLNKNFQFLTFTQHHFGKVMKNFGFLQHWFKGIVHVTLVFTYAHQVFDEMPK